jgi:oligosaccharide repeat unit polymerase
VFRLFIVFVFFTTLDLILYGIPLFSTDSDARLDRRSIYYFLLVQFSQLLCYVCAYHFAFYKKVTKFHLIVMLFLVAYNILLVSRGIIVHFVLFWCIAYLLISDINLWRKLFVISITSLLMLILFGVAGDLRQGGEFKIKEYGAFIVELPSFLYWLYGYVVINLDNLVLILRENLTSEYSKILVNFSPRIYSFFGEVPTDYDTLPYVGRFNLPTGFGLILYEFHYSVTFLFIFILSVFVKRSIRQLKGNFYNSFVSAYIIMGYFLLPVKNIFITKEFWIAVIIVSILRKFFSKLFAR